MADNNGTDLNSFQFHMVEEYSVANIKVEKLDEEIMKIKPEVIGGSRVHLDVDVKELLETENGYLESSTKQVLNENPALDTIKTVSTCKTSKMDDGNGTGLNSLQSHIKEECSLTNIKVEEVDEEIMKTEPELLGASWVHVNVDLKEPLENENGDLDSSAEQVVNENPALDTTIKSISTCSILRMADNNGTDLKLLQFHIKKQSSPPNVTVDKVDEEIMKNEPEVVGGTWVHQNVDVKEQLENENRNLESSAEQLLNENPVWVFRRTVFHNKVIEVNSSPGTKAFKDDLNICETINNLSTNCQKDNENGKIREKKKSQGDLIENVNINKKEEKEKLKFRHDDNDFLFKGALKKKVNAKGKKQKSEHDYCNTTEEKYQCNYEAHTINRPYKCNECPYAAVKKSTLIHHIKSHHTMEKPYKCKYCSYAAVQKCTLIYHIKSHHTMEKPYKCKDCSYATLKKRDLLCHIQSFHTMEKPYKCKDCSYAAVRKRDLLCHIKSLHTMEKPYKCNECAYGAVQRNSLISHIKQWHTMEKPYKCNKCSYSAIQKCHLLTHIKHRHSTEKPYKCNECPYAAVRKSALISHTKIRHAKERPYKCNDCSYAAGQKSNLMSHIERCHTMENSGMKSCPFKSC